MADLAMELPLGLRLLIQNLNALVQIKLDNSNYLVWKAQLQAILQANNLLDHVLDLSPCPNTVIIDSAGKSSPNPAHSTWMTTDLHLKTCLYASISPSVLPLVLHLPTASSIWLSLQKRFNSLSRSHLHQLKMKLCTLKKGTQAIQQYLDVATSISDSLTCAGEPIKDEDLILYILKGLPSEYDPFKACIRVRAEPITVPELSHLLLSEELNIQFSKETPFSEFSSTDVHTALYTNTTQFRGGHNQRGRGRNNSRGGRGQRGRGNTTSRGGFLGSQPSQIPSSQYSERPIYCQICEKPNHSAIECWYRLDTINYGIPKPEKQVLAAHFG